MNSPIQPRFHKLVDWVEGRLDPDESAEITHLLAVSGTDQKATVSWIRSVIASGQSMPMAAPPAGLRNDLEKAFRRRIAPWQPEEYLDARLNFDSNDRDIAVGMRSKETPTSNHLVFECGAVRLAIDIVQPNRERSDVQGLALWLDLDDNAHQTELMFTSKQSILHSTRCTSDGIFQLEGISSKVDEIWIVRGDRHIRAELPAHVFE